MPSDSDSGLPRASHRDHWQGLAVRHWQGSSHGDGHNDSQVTGMVPSQAVTVDDDRTRTVSRTDSSLGT